MCLTCAEKLELLIDGMMAEAQGFTEKETSPRKSSRKKKN
jgi:hypothetical protein